MGQLRQTPVTYHDYFPGMSPTAMRSSQTQVTEQFHCMAKQGLSGKSVQDRQLIDTSSRDTGSAHPQPMAFPTSGYIIASAVMYVIAISIDIDVEDRTRMLK